MEHSADLVALHLHHANLRRFHEELEMRERIEERGAAPSRRTPRRLALRLRRPRRAPRLAAR